MDNLLNFISVTGTFLVVFGSLFFIQRFTIGFIPFFKKEINTRISRGDVLFTLTSLLFIIAFVDFYKPY